MEVPRGSSSSKPSSRATPVKALASVPDPASYLSTRISSERLPEAYYRLSEARKSLEALSDAASKVQEGLHAVESDLKLLCRREDRDKTADMSLTTSCSDIDGLFTQVKKAVFLADAQIEKFCFKHKNAYSEKERKKAVTISLEKMANDVWSALMMVLNKPAKVQLAEARRAVAALHIQATGLTKGLKSSLDEVEEVLYDHLAEVGISSQQQTLSTERKGKNDSFDSQRGAQTTREGRQMPGVREELAAELQEDGRRMLASFEKYASSHRERGNSVSGARKEMNKVLKDMVSTVQLHCAGFGPNADAETWRMKKQALRIKKRIDGLCKEFEDRDSTSVQDYSIASVPTNYLRDTPSFDTGRNTPSFDTPDRGTPSRGFSLDPPTQSDPSDLRSESSGHNRTYSQGHPNNEIKGTRPTTGSDRIRPSTSQTNAIHARQETLNMDIADIRRRLDDLFPTSRGKNRSDSGSQVSAMTGLEGSDKDFIDQLTSQVGLERQSVDLFLQSLQNEGVYVDSLAEAGNEFHLLHEKLTTLQNEHTECITATEKLQNDLKNTLETDKTQIQQLLSELHQFRETAKNKAFSRSTDSQTVPILPNIESLSSLNLYPENVTVTFESEDTMESEAQEVKEVEVAAMAPDPEPVKSPNLLKATLTLAKHNKTRKSAISGRKSGLKGTPRLSTVQEAELEDSMEHEEEKKTAKSETHGTPKNGKYPVALPMSYIKAKGSKQEEGLKSNAKSVISVSLMQENRGKIQISASTEQLIKGMTGSKFVKVAENLINSSPEKPPTPKSATIPVKKLPIKESPVIFPLSPEEKTTLSKGKAQLLQTVKTVSDLRSKTMSIKESVLSERRSEGSIRSTSKAVVQRKGEEKGENNSKSGKMTVPKLVIPVGSEGKKEASPPVTFRPIPEVLASEKTTEVVIEGEEMSNSVDTPQEVEVSAAPSTEESDPESISSLNQLISEKVDVLKTIADEEAAIESEISTLSFAVFEEQYIEAKLAEWAAFPDLTRMCRLSQDLRHAHRRYDEVFREIQSLQDQIQREKCQMTCKISLLPVTSQVTEEVRAGLSAPVEVCGRASFEAWEWTLVRLAGMCTWVRPGVSSEALTTLEVTEKFREASRLLETHPGLPGDLVLATAELLQRA